eukprot:SAG11_NODE_902_length_6620_cov_3.401012_5_plen_123_part_00
MMGMMGSSMAGSMAGSVIGHGVSNMMFGGGGGGGGGGGDQAAPAAPAAAEGAAPAEYQDPCQAMLFKFQDCVKQSGDSMEACRFNLQSLRECRYNNNQVHHLGISPVCAASIAIHVSHSAIA